MSCDVGEVTKRLENELCSFSNLSIMTTKSTKAVRGHEKIQIITNCNWKEEISLQNLHFCTVHKKKRETIHMLLLIAPLHKVECFEGYHTLKFY